MCLTLFKTTRGRKEGKCVPQTSENAWLSLWQVVRSSLRNFPQIYVHTASCCANAIGEREKDEALFCILLIWRLHKAVSVRERNTCLYQTVCFRSLMICCTKFTLPPAVTAVTNLTSAYMFCTCFGFIWRRTLNGSYFWAVSVGLLEGTHQVSHFT